MKAYSFFLIIVFINLFFCQNEQKNRLSKSKEINEKSRVNSKPNSSAVKKTIEDFEVLVISYNPDQIDFASINDNLKDYDLEQIISSASVPERERWEAILLLKQYLFHLKNSNQSFNLFDMRKGKAGIIIDDFYTINKVDINDNFLSSGYTENVVRKNEKLMSVPFIQQLLFEIDKENKRIISREPWKE